MANELVTIEPSMTIDGEEIKVYGCSMREGLDEIGWAIVEVSKGEETPKPVDVIDKPAVITLERTDGSQKRQFAGIVIEAERFIHETGNQSLRLRVAPRAWKLSRRADCRTFLDMTAVDIVKKVLDKAGITDTRWETTETYLVKSYTVQYRETDLAFIERMLAEEGIRYFVDHAGGVDTMVFGDDPMGHGDIEAPTALEFAQHFGHTESRDVVTRVRRRQRVKSDKVMLRDYDFEKPKLKLEAKVEGKDDGAKALEVYRYPGRFVDVDEGKRLAQVLLDSMQCERDVLSGEAGVLTLKPGFKFSIENHPLPTLNGELLLTLVEIELRRGRQNDDTGSNQYVCRWTAIPPAKSTHRPRRLEPTQVIPEVQTAITTGPAGEEIHADEHGRVKVQFYWDREGKKDEKSSQPFRTTQVPTGGSVFLPRMKWEVAVRFEEGDVDRPQVFGRMYNGINKPPYPLPEGKAKGSIQTATTPGGGSTNEMRTSDAKGSEEMFFNASKDMTIDVKNNATESVGNNSSCEVGANHSLDVTNSLHTKVGANQSTTVSANQNVKVATFKVDDITGDHSKDVGAARNMKVGGDHRLTVSGASKLEVSAMETHLVVGSVSETTPDIDHKVGAALVEITAKDRSTTVGGQHTETCSLAKVIVTAGGVGSEVGGMFMQQVGGAILTKISGDRNDASAAAFTEIAAGASIVKAANIVIEAETMLTLVMGASILNITPASVTFLGTSIKFDGPTVDTAPLILDN